MTSTKMLKYSSSAVTMLCCALSYSVLAFDFDSHAQKVKVKDEVKASVQEIKDKVISEVEKLKENAKNYKPDAKNVEPKDDMPYEDDQQSVPKFVKNFVGAKELIREKSFSTGFESLEEFKNFYIVPQNYQGAASHDLVSDIVKKGKKAHKAWVYKEYRGKRGQNNNHRAYPTFQLNKTDLGIVKTKVLVEFDVLADVELSKVPDQNWLSLATFTSYSDVNWHRSYLINVDRNYRLHLMHIPHQGLNVPDIASNLDAILPQNEWAKITAYIDYSKDNRFDSPFIAVWLDGVLASAARFSDRIELKRIPKNDYPKCLDGWDGKDMTIAEKLCGLSYEHGLAQMHFGMYAPPKVKRGVVYNDDLVVSRIAELR